MASTGADEGGTGAKPAEAAPTQAPTQAGGAGSREVGASGPPSAAAEKPNSGAEMTGREAMDVDAPAETKPAAASEPTPAKTEGADAPAPGAATEGAKGAATAKPGLEHPPQVFVSPTISDPALALRLKQTITKLGGRIAPASAFPGVTHVIHPESAAAAASSDPSPGGNAAGKVGDVWHVTSAWVSRSESQGKWVDEGEFAAKEPAEEGPPAKRLKSDPATPAAAPTSAADGAPAQSPPALELDIQPKGVRAMEEMPTPTALPSQPPNPTPGAGAGTGAGAGAGAGAAMGPPPGVPQPPPATTMVPLKGVLLEKELYVVPAHASWFKWETIHEIERASLPEFFSGRVPSKTPKIYKGYRDFIINTFRADVSKKITFTQCREKLAGDVNAIHRVFAFLEHWGLINFSVRSLGPPTTPLLEGSGVGGGGGVGSDKAAGVNQSGGAAKMKDAEGGSVPSGPPAELRVVLARTGHDVNNLVQLKAPSRQAFLPESALGLVTQQGKGGGVAPNEIPAPASGMQFVCNISGKDCTQLRYHCTKIPDYDLSETSYEQCKRDNKFPTGITADDFVRLDGSSRAKNGDDPAAWSNEETLLLLEALEYYGENWHEVSEHVGTKSQLQCIHHFLGLPIEDAFLDELEGQIQDRTLYSDRQGAGGGGKGGGGAGSLDPIPFADTGNPVMAQVAFLATMVGPKVAAAAAQKALEVLSKTEPYAVANFAPPKPPSAAGTGGPAGAQQGGGQAAAPEAASADGDAHGASGAPGASGAMGAPTASGKGKDGPFPAAAVKAAAATGLAAAAVKAKLMADREEQEIQKLVIQVVEKQMLKLEMKLKAFEDLDSLLEKEKAELATARLHLFAEKVALHAQALQQRESRGASGAGPPAAAQTAGTPQGAPAAPAPGDGDANAPQPMATDSPTDGAAPEAATGPSPTPATAGVAAGGAPTTAEAPKDASKDSGAAPSLPPPEGKEGKEGVGEASVEPTRPKAALPVGEGEGNGGAPEAKQTEGGAVVSSAANGNKEGGDPAAGPRDVAGEKKEQEGGGGRKKRLLLERKRRKRRSEARE